MKEIILWEHGHAYQPRRIIDGVTEAIREIPGSVSIYVAGEKQAGRNWFELMLKPKSVYDLIVKTASGRSMDVEPITLSYLREVNPKVFEELRRKVLIGETYFIASLYSHPLLPILVENSTLDADVNVTWGLRFFKQAFHEGADLRVIGFWFSECAYSKESAQLVLKTACRVFGENIRPLFLLDEWQAEGADPGKIYCMPVNSIETFVILRFHGLSDAYAFCSDYVWIIEQLRREIASKSPSVIGVMTDAETYGGAYDPHKPALFAQLHEGLKGGMTIGGDKIHVELKTVDKLVDRLGGLGEVELPDYTAWSDYRKNLLFTAEHPRIESIVARTAGGLCRWTGYLRGENGKSTNETYFMVFEWVHPVTKKRYVRVVSSIWKIALNTVRRMGSTLVRQAVFDLMGRFVEKETIVEILRTYGDVVLGQKTLDEFLNDFGQVTGKGRRIMALALEAYRRANQDSVISCPTFWQNLDTEVSWTALAYVAGGMALAAKAYHESGGEEKACFIAEKYRELFLDFERYFQHLVDDYSLPLEILYEQLEKAAKLRGYDVEKDIAEVKTGLDARAGEIAEKLYDSALGTIGGDRPFLKTDANKFLVLSKMLDRAGKREASRQAYYDAKLFEWKKSIGSAVSTHPLPVRVGIFHATHIPNHERLLKIPTISVETATEMIIGEAHAYDP